MIERGNRLALYLLMTPFLLWLLLLIILPHVQMLNISVQDRAIGGATRSAWTTTRRFSLNPFTGARLCERQ